MSMRALDLGLSRRTLVTGTRGVELLYHLRLIDGIDKVKVKDVSYKNVMDNDECRIYHKGALVALTSTQELGMLIKAARLHTFALVEVHTLNEMYYAAVPEGLLVKEYVGVTTDSLGRVVSFVQEVNGTYWSQDGKRLIHIDEALDKKTAIKLNAQESIKYINKHPNQFNGVNCGVVTFKEGVE